MDARERITQETYDRIAKQWVEEHSNVDYFRSEFEKFQSLLTRGRILDVGCGAGRDFQFFRGNEYDYTGVDYSKGLLKFARQQFPEAKFVEADILELPFADNEFDGFWAAASLLHILKAKIDTALQSIKRVMKPGSVGFIALKKGEGERMVTDDNENGESRDERFFAYLQKDEFEKVLRQNGFAVIDFFEHPVSERTTWLSFFVRSI